MEKIAEITEKAPNSELKLRKMHSCYANIKTASFSSCFVVGRFLLVVPVRSKCLFYCMIEMGASAISRKQEQKSPKKSRGIDSVHFRVVHAIVARHIVPNVA